MRGLITREKNRVNESRDRFIFELIVSENRIRRASNLRHGRRRGRRRGLRRTVAVAASTGRP